MLSARKYSIVSAIAVPEARHTNNSAPAKCSEAQCGVEEPPVSVIACWKHATYSTIVACFQHAFHSVCSLPPHTALRLYGVNRITCFQHDS